MDRQHQIDPFGRVVAAGSESHTGGHPLIPPPPVITGRSPRWPAFVHQLLRERPLCEGCGRRSETGHHVIPFHVRPDLELDPGNVVPVCPPCPFVVCHGGNWQLYIPTARADLAAHLARVRAAKKAG